MAVENLDKQGVLRGAIVADVNVFRSKWLAQLLESWSWLAMR